MLEVGRSSLSPASVPTAVGVLAVTITSGSIIELLMCARYCSKHRPCTVSVIFHHRPVTEILLLSHFPNRGK